LTINHDFEGEASVDSFTNLKPVKNKSVVFCANLAAGAMEKVISNQQKLMRIYFLLQKGVRQFYSKTHINHLLL